MNTAIDPNAQSIEIALSKRKLILLLIGSLIFVFIGIDFLLDPNRYANTGFRHSPVTLIIVIGLSSIAFFGLCAVISFYKFFDKKPGLIIDSESIKINAALKDYIKCSKIEKFVIKQ